MASGKSNTFCQSLLDLVYAATLFANVAINATSSPITNIYAALHTATLSATSVQNTSEAAYTGYGRVPVVRTSSGWHRSNQTESNVAAIIFGTCTAGSETETYGSSGTTSTGATAILHWGALTSSVAVSTGNPIPSFAIDAFAVTEA